MIYLEEAPNPLLRSWVRTLWYCRAPHFPRRRERVLPNGCMQIILNLSRSYLTDCGEDGKANRRLPRAIVVGTRARYEVVDTADMEELAGILFQPGGFAGLFRERANLFFERSIALDDVWVGARLTDRLSEVPTPVERLRALEVLLTQLVHQGTRRSELVDHAVSPRTRCDSARRSPVGLLGWIRRHHGVRILSDNCRPGCLGDCPGSGRTIHA